MPKIELDPKSADPVIHYRGPGIVAGVPADDLSANTLARIAWINGGQKGSPEDIKPADIAKVRDELVATGKYATEKA